MSSVGAATWRGAKLAVVTAVAFSGAVAAGYLTATKTVTPMNVLSLAVVGTTCLVAGPVVLSFLFLTAGTVPLLSAYGERAMGLLDNNVTPLGTLLFLVGLLLVVAVLFHRTTAIGISVRRGWGVKYVVAYVVAGFLLMPAYEFPMDQAWVLAHYFAVPILAVIFATYPDASRTFRVTRGQLVLLSFILVGAYAVFTVSGVVTGDYVFLGRRAMSYFGGVRAERFTGLAGMYGASNDSSAMLLSLLPFALAWLHTRRRSLFWQVLVLLFATYFIIMFQTRSVWLAYPVVLAVFLAGTYPIRRRWIYAFVLLAVSIGAVLAFPSIGARFAELVHTGGIGGGNANNLGARWSSLVWTVHRVMEDPVTVLIGVGGGGWERMASAAGQALDVAHNLWATLLADGGIIAVGLWGAFFVTFFRNAVRAVLRLRPEDRLWPVAGVASMIALVVWSMSGNYLNYGGPVLSVLVALMTWSACELLQENALRGSARRDG